MEVEVSYLRKQKAEEMLSVFRSGIPKMDDLRVEECNNAVILPGKYSDDSFTYLLGGVLDQYGNFVKLSENVEYFGGKYEPEEVKVSDKTVVYCGYWNLHWGHFLVDIVPRLWWILDAEKDVDEYIILVNKKDQIISGNVKEFFELLGISNKIIMLSEAIQYKCIIVPQLSYHYGRIENSCVVGRYYSSQYIRVFDKVVEKALASYTYEDEKAVYKNIFLTRSGLDFSDKRDCGIEMIDSFFRNNDYCMIFPESCSLKKLIFIMNHCTNFAGISGTACHNLLFVIKKPNVLIIERNAEICNIQNDINMMRELDVTFVDANSYIFPVEDHVGPFIYTYGEHMKRYTEDMKMNPPDYQYIQGQYKNKIIRKYLENYRILQEYWFKNVSEYIWEVSNACIKELEPDFEISYSENYSGLINDAELKRRVADCLIRYDIVYSKWRHLNLYMESVRTIEKKIFLQKTDFLIYPFGRNGMAFKYILNERYGIKEKAIFDNELCRFNEKIRPLNEINSFIDTKTCVIMTTARCDCWHELMKYCDVNIIEGLFAFSS